MIALLNLTESAITLIAASGEAATIEPSEYVARVEAARDTVSTWHNAAPEQEFDLPIIEETPTEIQIDGSAWCDDIIAHGSDLLLVTRSVAEAAHALKHPLAARMVWATDGIEGIPCPESCNMHGLKEYICSKHSCLIGYRALRSVPQMSNQ